MEIVYGKSFRCYEEHKSMYIKLIFISAWDRGKVLKYINNTLHMDTTDDDPNHLERVLCRDSNFSMTSWCVINSYKSYKKESISLSLLKEDIHSWIVKQDVSEDELKILINYIKNKNINIIHQINNNTTIRKGSNGYYIFYKTVKMKKPKFFKFPNELIDDIYKIKEYIEKKYKTIC